MAQKPKRERHTSPAGIAVYPRVDGKPDTKFDKGGVWQIQLAYEGKTAEKFKAQIDEWMEKALDEAKEEKPSKAKKMILSDPPYQPEYVKDEDGKNTDEETGRTLVRFKLKATGEKRDGTTYSQHVTVLKADLTPFTNSRLGGGSKVKVGYEVVLFSMSVPGGKIACGVSLKLRTVQVLDYVAWEGGTDPKSFGMVAEEGFTDDDDEETKEVNDEEDDDEEEEDDEPVKKPAKGKKSKPEPEPEEEEEDEEEEEEEEEEKPAKKPAKGKGKKPSPDKDDF